MGSVKIKIKPYKNCELRAMYGMENRKKEWKKQMDKIKHLVGERDGQTYHIKQVMVIFSKLDVPDELLVDELDLKCKKINDNAA